MKKPILEIDSISKKYNEINVGISELSLKIGQQERVGIVGASGSGKSTVLKIMAGLLQMDSGSVLLEGKPLMQPKDQLIPGHAEIAYLSQHFELPKFISVVDHLEDTFLISNADAQEIYKSCNIEHLLDRDTRALSGGEKQRVVLAKLLMRSPKILLLDEPFTNLDYENKSALKAAINEIESNLSTTVSMVTHDPRDVLPWADRILTLREGKLIQIGSSREIYENPIDEYVAGLFGAYNKIVLNNWQPDITKSAIGNDLLILRPEKFEILEHGGRSGKIVSKSYHGSHDEYTVQVDEELVLIRSNVGDFQVGDDINLGLAL